MDGQNFENENNVTVDTTATEVSSTAEPAQETPAAEQPANNYQDYTTNVQPQVAVTTPVQPENKDTNVLAIIIVLFWYIVCSCSAAGVSCAGSAVELTSVAVVSTVTLFSFSKFCPSIFSSFRSFQDLSLFNLPAGYLYHLH